MSAYPKTAGYKEETTSKAAAERIEATGRAASIRDRLMRLFQAGRVLTCYDAERELGVSQFSLRPRLTELQHQGKIRKAWKKTGPDGKQIWAWAAVDARRV